MILFNILESEDSYEDLELIISKATIFRAENNGWMLTGQDDRPN